MRLKLAVRKIKIESSKFNQMDEHKTQISSSRSNEKETSIALARV